MTKDLDDGYMGSGKLIRHAIKKHGKENFKKEILHIFDNEEAMNAKEAELVVVSEETYNLCDGGEGGWSYVNKLEKMRHIRLQNLQIIEKEVLVQNGKNTGLKYTKKTHSEGKLKHTYFGQNAPHMMLVQKRLSAPEVKEKRKNTMAANNHQKGEKNSQYGTMWITNGEINMKISKNKQVPENYRKGRI
jgi:hypothetical protein